MEKNSTFTYRVHLNSEYFFDLNLFSHKNVGLHKLHAQGSEKKRFRKNTDNELKKSPSFYIFIYFFHSQSIMNIDEHGWHYAAPNYFYR